MQIVSTVFSDISAARVDGEVLSSSPLFKREGTRLCSTAVTAFGTTSKSLIYCSSFLIKLKCNTSIILVAL